MGKFRTHYSRTVSPFLSAYPTFTYHPRHDVSYMVALTPEVVAGAVLFLLAVLGELYTNFTRKRVNYLRRKQRTAMDAHAAIPDLVETVERVEDKVDGVDDKVTTTQKTIAYLHREELPDDPLARERLDVEADDDFFNGGD